MKRKSGIIAFGMFLGLVAGQAMAEDDRIDVTLEVLDDVTDVDGVVLILEEQDEHDRRFDEEDGGEHRDGERRDDEFGDGDFGDRDLSDGEHSDGDHADGDFDGRIEDRDLERDRDDSIVEEEHDVVDEPVDEPVDELVDEPVDEPVDELVDEPVA